MLAPDERRGRRRRREEAEGGPSGVSAASGNKLCWRHHRRLEVFCRTDQRVLCAGCASADHGGHTLGLVGEERRRREEELQKMKMRTGKLLRKQEARLRNKRLDLDQIREAANETEDYCERVLVGAIGSLQRRFLSVKTLIRVQEEAAAAQAQVSLRNLQATVEEVRKRRDELDRLAQMDCDASFMQEWPSVQRHHGEDQPLCDPAVDHLQPFKSIQLTFSRLERQLEDLCDKEFAPLTQTDDSMEELGGDTTEDSEDEEDLRSDHGEMSHGGGEKTTAEPTTRVEFLRYACELTLDPDTAHQHLQLSQDNKSVQMCPQKGQGTAADRRPERFTSRRQVLCKEGLQGARCYYEVEVSGDKAEIALAYKSINRRSLNQASAFGGGADSWSLDRSSTYSVSHKSNSIQLKIPPGCSRIGVYLKFKEGSLSFYEVAGSMTFLYKMEAQFKEPLYPGFWLGEKCRIRICDLQRDAS